MKIIFKKKSNQEEKTGGTEKQNAPGRHHRGELESLVLAYRSGEEEGRQVQILCGPQSGELGDTEPATPSTTSR